MPRSRTRLSLAITAGLLLVLGACGSDDSGDDGGGGTDTGTESVTVVAVDFSFDTTSLELEPGATVELTLQNDGDAPHTFSSDDVDVSIAADPGASASGTFTVPDEEGTYEFHCEIHPDQMTGEIIVGSGDAGSTEDTTETDTSENEDTTEGSSENDDGY